MPKSLQYLTAFHTPVISEYRKSFTFPNFVFGSITKKPPFDFEIFRMAFRVSLQETAFFFENATKLFLSLNT